VLQSKLELLTGASMRARSRLCTRVSSRARVCVPARFADKEKEEEDSRVRAQLLREVETMVQLQRGVQQRDQTMRAKVQQIINGGACGSPRSGGGVRGHSCPPHACRAAPKSRVKRLGASNRQPNRVSGCAQPLHRIRRRCASSWRCSRRCAAEAAIVACATAPALSDAGHADQCGRDLRAGRGDEVLRGPAGAERAVAQAGQWADGRASPRHCTRRWVRA
jgi:hypothetical protein